MRNRIPSQPIIDHRDFPNMPESDREWCARLLKEHEERYHSPNSSIPVKITSKWVSFSGGWKPAVVILLICAAVAITYLIRRT